MTANITRQPAEMNLPAQLSLDGWPEKPGTQVAMQRPLFRKKPWSHKWHRSRWLHCKHPRGQTAKEKTHVRHSWGTPPGRTTQGQKGAATRRAKAPATNKCPPRYNKRACSFPVDICQEPISHQEETESLGPPLNLYKRHLKNTAYGQMFLKAYWLVRGGV